MPDEPVTEVEADPDCQEVDFYGEKIRLNPDGISEFALMEFAEAASGDMDADGMTGMAVMLRTVCDGIYEKDRPKFRSLARKNRATSGDLTPLLKAVFEGQGEHPTGLPSDSTDGQEATERKSEQSSGAKVTALYPSRPDMAMGILRSKAG